MKGRGLTVQVWFRLVLALTAILVLTAALVGSTLLDRTGRASDRLVDQISPARTEAYRLQAALLDQETGVRGFAIAGDPQFLDPYNRGLAAEKDAGTRLADLVRDEPALGQDLRQVLAAGDAWRREYATRVIGAVKTGGGGPIDKATIAQGKELFDVLRVGWNAQTRHLAETRREALAERAHDETVRDWVFIGMLTGFLLACVLLAVLLEVAVIRPLKSLRASSRKVAEGDFDQVIAGQGPADLRAVAVDVEAMRERIVAELAQSTDREDLLQKQTLELKRSNAELEQFAYVASHDLQEPLRKVASFCQMLERRYSSQLDERGLKYIEFAVDGATRMQILINDLLTFSRVGRVQDEHQRVSLDGPLDLALSNLDTALEESGAEVVRPEAMPEVIGDPSLLAMLFQNLVGNAIKFRSPDRSPRVEIGCEQLEDGWQIGVTDNGIGIEPEFADKIFVIFQRLHNRETYTGTGIGLALCKKIVEYHGGRIWLDTEYTGGTRLNFTICTTEGESK
ncbi:MAG: ATP-binding protein [Streptosporangiaceae bacterium]